MFCIAEFEQEFISDSAYAFQEYQKPYPNTTFWSEQEITRPLHGMQHATRAAIYALVFVSLYRRYRDPSALALTHEDIYLLQVALYFHDIAREGDGIDLWDKQSAAALYNYLTTVKGINKDKAILFAEAIANKDADPQDAYHQLVVGPDGTLTWESVVRRTPKNIYQKIIHDADCLDIIRARSDFSATYLDFYKHIASINHQALEEMSELILEVRSLIFLQGDFPSKKNTEAKLHFESPLCYQLTCELIQARGYLLLNRLLSIPEKMVDEQYPLLLASHKQAKGSELTEEFLQDAMTNHFVFARGIRDPAELSSKHDETNAHLELRKASRRYGTPTQTLKPDRALKHGNPFRSMCMIGLGATVFADAGFLIANPDLDAIQKISPVGLLSGKGKKKHLSLPTLTREEKALQLIKLRNDLMQGDPVGSNNFLTGTEILYHVTHYDAIYYTTDSTIHFASYPQTAALRAIYLQREYELVYHQRLPIFCYSRVHNTIQKVNFTPDRLVELWEAVYRDFLSEHPESLNKTRDEILSQCNNEKSISFSNYDSILSERILYKIREVIDEEQQAYREFKLNDAKTSQIISQGHLSFFGRSPIQNISKMNTHNTIEEFILS